MRVNLPKGTGPPPLQLAIIFHNVVILEVYFFVYNVIRALLRRSAPLLIPASKLGFRR